MLSEVKDAVPLEGRPAFYNMLFKSMQTKQYAEITDLPAPWQEQVMAKYREWQMRGGTSASQPGGNRGCGEA